jgi:hypothetical protein
MRKEQHLSSSTWILVLVGSLGMRDGRRGASGERAPAQKKSKIDNDDSLQESDLEVDDKEGQDDSESETGGPGSRRDGRIRA